MTRTRHERMSSVDTAWLRMDSAVNSMVILSVTVTETPISVARFRRLVNERFLCFPRFRQRPVPDALGAAWVDDDAFDLDAHIHVVALPPAAGRAELEALAAELASSRLDSDRPLWQMHLVADYRGGSAWIMRIHHCYADGIAMVRVLLSMTEDRGAGGGRQGGRTRRRPRLELLPLIDWIGQISPPAGDALEAALSEGARLIETGLKQALHPEQAAVLARHAGGMVGELARLIALPDDPSTAYRAALSGRKSVAWADPLPLEDVKTIGHALECTVNDVLMSTVAGALGAWLGEQGHDIRGLTVRATVPVNLRGVEKALALGNRFGLIFVDMPLGMRNPLRRLYEMHSTLSALKGSMQPPMTLAMLGLLGMLPAGLQGPAVELFSRKGTVVVSNLPGPKVPLYLCGQSISEMYFWVPQSGSMGIGVSVLTYAGRVHVGMIADRNLVPDTQRVVDLFAPEFERLRQFVGAGALEARTQGSGKPAGTATARKSARKATGGRLGPKRKSRKRRGGPRKGTNKTTPRRAD
jgi:diacylglycerol O-acyltransferase / wax synthase